ncbi:MAG: hypothetical protein H0W72_09900, partial [Planctomycetes bacterium]|nr:hypothetical protein [Planctomycetota bacterium]
GDAERRIADMKDLLRQARDSVLAAKKRQVDDQGALTALRQQIEKLGGKPKV